MPAGFEFREVDFDRVLVPDNGPLGKLAGSTRFLAGGWSKGSGAFDLRFWEPCEEDKSFSELVMLSVRDAWMLSSLAFED